MQLLPAPWLSDSSILIFNYCQMDGNSSKEEEKRAEARPCEKICSGWLTACFAATATEDEELTSPAPVQGARRGSVGFKTQIRLKPLEMTPLESEPGLKKHWGQKFKTAKMQLPLKCLCLSIFNCSVTLPVCLISQHESLKRPETLSPIKMCPFSWVSKHVVVTFDSLIRYFLISV